MNCCPRWFAGRCIADYDATADMIGRMRRAGHTVQAIHRMVRQSRSSQLKIRQGLRRPTTTEGVRGAAEELQEEVQRRAEEARKKWTAAQAAAPARCRGR